MAQNQGYTTSWGRSRNHLTCRLKAEVKRKAHSLAAILLSFLITAQLKAAPHSKKDENPTVLSVRAQVPKCQVDIDGTASGTTDSHGVLIIMNVEPGDHYVHADCPGKQEIARFVSVPAGLTTNLNLADNGPTEPVTPLQVAQNNIRLRDMVLKAVQLRAREQFGEAVTLLRKATLLDPSNSDLHRELGITFLLEKDWENARVEMTEAIRHDPGDADAHNGLGYALEKMGDLKAALTQYYAATHLDPTDDSYRDHYDEVMIKLASQPPAGKKP
jgi:hypothetical protein